MPETNILRDPCFVSDSVLEVFKFMLQVVFHR